MKACTNNDLVRSFISSIFSRDSLSVSSPRSSSSNDCRLLISPKNICIYDVMSMIRLLIFRISIHKWNFINDISTSRHDIDPLIRWYISDDTIYQLLIRNRTREKNHDEQYYQHLFDCISFQSTTILTHYIESSVKLQFIWCSTFIVVISLWIPIYNWFWMNLMYPVVIHVRFLYHTTDGFQ